MALLRAPRPPVRMSPMIHLARYSEPGPWDRAPRLQAPSGCPTPRSVSDGHRLGQTEGLCATPSSSATSATRRSRVQSRRPPERAVAAMRWTSTYPIPRPINRWTSMYPRASSSDATTAWGRLRRSPSTSFRLRIRPQASSPTMKGCVNTMPRSKALVSSALPPRRWSTQTDVSTRITFRPPAGAKARPTQARFLRVWRGDGPTRVRRGLADPPGSTRCVPWCR